MNLLLASNSPRRKELLTQLGYQFDIVKIDVDESYPEDLKPNQIAEYVSAKKAKALEDRRINKSKDESIEDTIIAYEKKSILIEKAFDKHAQAVILRRMERELEKLEDEKIVLSPDYKYEYVAPPEEVFIKSREVEGDILKLSNVSKIFEDKTLYKDVNLAIHSDSKICIVGENGSGKSTLLRIMLGQEEPTSGEVFINETAKITYIAQETYFENEKILVIFCKWNPYRVFLGAYIFGGLDILGFRIQHLDIKISQYFIDMLPYLVTIIILVISSVKKDKTFGPKALGNNFFREER